MSAWKVVLKTSIISLMQLSINMENRTQQTFLNTSYLHINQHIGTLSVIPLSFKPNAVCQIKIAVEHGDINIMQK